MTSFKKSTYLKTILGLIVMDLAAHAQAPPTLWSKTYGGTSYDIGYAVQQTSEGGYIIVGETNSFGAGMTDVYLIKTDAYGNIAWWNTFGTVGLEVGQSIISIKETSDGGYVIAGYNDGYDVHLIKTDNSGNMEWERTYGGSLYDFGRSVQETADHGFIIAGSTESFGNGSYDVYLIKTDQDGNLQWEKTFGGADWDEGWCVQVTYEANEERFIIAGITLSFGAGATDVYLIKTDALGNEIWSRTYGHPGYDDAYFVNKTSAGGYIIAGMRSVDSDGQVYLIKTDQAGDIIWDRTYGRSDYYDEGRAVQETYDGGYIVTGYTERVDQDIYVIKITADGSFDWDQTYGGSMDEKGYSVQQTLDGGYVIAGYTNSEGAGSYDVYVIKTASEYTGIGLGDELALAYNGNRHLVQKPNSEELHLVYTFENKIIYLYSSDGGNTWTLPFVVGDGAFPAVALDVDGLPVVAWFECGQLYYRKQADLQGNWSDPIVLYTPSGAEASSISPPSIVITSHPLAVDTVHILFSASILYQVSPNGNNTWLFEYSFPINNSSQLTAKILYLDTEYRPEPPFPSIARDLNQTLHAVWNWADTTNYATREVEQEWNNWGPQFDLDGLQSAHPFVETYGDSVFVVWQHIEPTTLKEEIYRASRHIIETFDWRPFSETLNKVSLYPVNMFGLVTTFVDEPELIPPNTFFETYWKSTTEPWLHNISQSPMVKSIFPHTAMRFNQIADNELYVVWQEGNEAPYEIKFKREWVPGFIPAFLTSIGGDSVPSPYLVEWDTFFSDWAIPVDAGYQTVTYRFPLEPGYRYKIKVVAYHESSGEWREWVVIDGREKHLIKYDACEPETLEFWVPPAFYQDGVIEVVFDRVKGDFATVGLIWIYCLEYEEELGEQVSSGGPMAQESHTVSTTSFMITPNPFTQTSAIALQTQSQERVSVKVYDISGRLVKNLYKGVINGEGVINWYGDDENGRAIAQGVYFLHIDNLNTGQISVHKVLKIR